MNTPPPLNVRSSYAVPLGLNRDLVVDRCDQCSRASLPCPILKFGSSIMLQWCQCIHCSKSVFTVDCLTWIPCNNCCTYSTCILACLISDVNTWSCRASLRRSWGRWSSRRQNRLAYRIKIEDKKLEDVGTQQQLICLSVRVSGKRET